MGVRNYLVEGVSGTGKTSVCRGLNRRGYQAINGDRELAYEGDPEIGEAIDTALHQHHIWDVGRLRALAADDQESMTFFCGGSRNFLMFIDLFDELFVLDIDLKPCSGGSPSAQKTSGAQNHPSASSSFGSTGPRRTSRVPE